MVEEYTKNNKSLSFERIYSHKIIENLYSKYPKIAPQDIKNSFKKYFEYVSFKKSKGYNYDKRLEELMCKIESEWIKENF